MNTQTDRKVKHFEVSAELFYAIVRTLGALPHDQVFTLMNKITDESKAVFEEEGKIVSFPEDAETLQNATKEV